MYICDVLNLIYDIVKWIRDIGVGCTQLYTVNANIKGSNTRVLSHSSLCVLFITTKATLAVNNDDGSNWEWLRDYLSVSTMWSDWFFLVGLLVTF